MHVEANSSSFGHPLCPLKWFNLNKWLLFVFKKKHWRGNHPQCPESDSSRDPDSHGAGNESGDGLHCDVCPPFVPSARLCHCFCSCSILNCLFFVTHVSRTLCERKILKALEIPNFPDFWDNVIPLVFETMRNSHLQWVDIPACEALWQRSPSKRLNAFACVVFFCGFSLMQSVLFCCNFVLFVESIFRGIPFSGFGPLRGWPAKVCLRGFAPLVNSNDVEMFGRGKNAMCMHSDNMVWFCMNLSFNVNSWVLYDFLEKSIFD